MMLPVNKPLSIGEFSDEQFNAEMEKEFTSIAAGRVKPARIVADMMRRDYGI